METEEAQAAAEAAAAAGIQVSPDGSTATVDRAAVEEAKAAAAAQEETDALLAGKFKTQDDLVKAYKELEGKLGQKPQQPAAEAEGEAAEGEAAEAEGEAAEGDNSQEADPVETTYGKVVAEAIKAADVDVAAASAEFEKDGKLSEETMAKFDKAGFPKEVVDAYLRGVSAPKQQATEMAQTQIDTIKGAVGGEEGFAELKKYVATNYSPEEKKAYNAAVASGDFEKAMGAVAAANVRRTQEFGKEAKLLGGKTAATSEGFGSDAEVKEAMRDPRYKTSSHYRAEVERKIAASTFYHVR